MKLRKFWSIGGGGGEGALGVPPLGPVTGTDMPQSNFAKYKLSQFMFVH